MAMLIAATLTACDDKLADSVTTIAPTMSVNLPQDLQGATITNEQIQVNNVSTKQTATFTSRADIKLLTGLYDISYDADASLPGDTTVHHIKAFSPSVEVSAANQTITFDTFEAETNDDFIISEIFFTGTLRSTGKQYYGDDYVKIYNNTDHVLYADGLALVESKFITTQKFNYRPNIMDTAMTVQAIYVIPGSGKEHPVQPGESMILADTGIDHRVANPNSFDLSNADFEWYDVSTVPAHMDIDSPTVPNLDKWYCYTLSFFVLHNRGFRAYGLVRFPIDKDTSQQLPLHLQLRDYCASRHIPDVANGLLCAKQVDCRCSQLQCRGKIRMECHIAQARPWLDILRHYGPRQDTLLPRRAPQNALSERRPPIPQRHQQLV